MQAVCRKIKEVEILPGSLSVILEIKTDGIPRETVCIMAERVGFELTLLE